MSRRQEGFRRMDSQNLVDILQDKNAGISSIEKNFCSVEDVVKSNTYNCWKNPFIICEFSKICTTNSSFYESIDSCMSKYFESDSFAVEERKAVIEDTNFYKWSVFGSELFLFLLNNISHRIDDYSGREFEWINLHGNDKVLPLHPNLNLSLADRKINLRPSEFSSYSSIKEPCRVASILSKSDKDVLALYGDISSSGDFYALVGSAMHKLYNTQPVGRKFIHNMTLKASGIEPVNRDSYCEVDVKGSLGDIVWGGSCDSVFCFGNNVLIEDLKRFRHTSREQFGKVLQTSAYGLAVMQSTEAVSNGKLVVGTIKRNVTSKSVKHRYPRTNMTLVEDEYKKDFYTRLERHSDFQKEVHHDPDIFFKEIALMESCDKGQLQDKRLNKEYRKRIPCSTCFSKNLCVSARCAVKEKGNVQSILEPKYSLI